MNNFYVIPCILFLNSVLLTGQTCCDTLKRLRLELTQKDKEYRLETSAQKRATIYSAYRAISEKAIGPTKRCIASKNFISGSIDELKDHYSLAKLYYQCGKCTEAQNVFKKCLANPNCGSQKIGTSSTYAQVINGAFVKCAVLKMDASSSNGYGLEYRGKGGAFLKNLFNGIDSEIFDDTPLTVDEVETICQRRLNSASLIDSSLVFGLSGNKTFLLSPPFIFMQGTAKFLAMPLKQEKNLELETESGIAPPSLAEYGSFMIKSYEILKIDYFNKFNPSSDLISVYLLGGRYDTEGLSNYLKFCNRVHFRAHKRVAYYMPADNSILAWTSSGGGTLIHELVHALVANDYPEAPQWLNEGLASLYEEVREDKPFNNYRLIFVQRALLEYKVCIKWIDLLESEKYSQADEMNYNMLCAYSRYFCKFIYDKYGKETLAKLYKQCRDDAVNTSTRQSEIIMQLTGKTEPELQGEWQQYILNEKVPAKWRGLVNEIEEDIGHEHKFIFIKSEIRTELKPEPKPVPAPEIKSPDSKKKMTK